MTKELKEGYMYIPTPRKLWLKLEEKYAVSDQSRIFNIKKQLPVSRSSGIQNAVSEGDSESKKESDLSSISQMVQRVMKKYLKSKEGAESPVPTSYFADFAVDDFSRCVWIYLMQSKGQTVGLLDEFLKYVKNFFSANVKCFKTDNGSEFLSGNCQKLLKDRGIVHQRACVYTPQENGVVERKHRHLARVARVMLIRAGEDNDDKSNDLEVTEQEPSPVIHAEIEEEHNAEDLEHNVETELVQIEDFAPVADVEQPIQREVATRRSTRERREPAWMKNYNRTLLSPNSNFSAGFQRTSADLFIFSVWFTDIPQNAVVWSANPNSPINASASLVITAKGELLLDGSPFRNASSASNSTSLVLRNNGNLVFGDWTSFANPTNTILPNQSIAGIELNSDNGEFRFVDSLTLTLNSESGVDYYNTPSPLVSMDVAGKMTMQGSFFLTSDYGEDRPRKFVLDDDGNLRIYSFKENEWVVVWIAIWELCKIKERLLYGYWSPGTETSMFLKVDKSESDTPNFMGMTQVLQTSCPVQISLPLPPKDSDSTTRNIVIICTLFAAEFISGVAFFWSFLKRYIKYRDMATTLGLELLLPAAGGPKRFAYSELKAATKDFSDLIGRGGFGDVYKGELSDHRVVAVKCLKNVAGGDNEFWAEVTIIARMHHLNLPENILLGEDFCPKISDFGLAKLRKKEDMVTMSRRRGTPGYMAPEWITTDPITSKADVYSFGMVLLELVSGIRNFEIQGSLLHSEEWYFPGWAFDKMFREMRVEDILDRQIKHCYDSRAHFDMINRMIKTAMWCLQDRPEMRPSMGKVAKMLEGTVEIIEPKKPTVFFLGDE
ncbi:G-type lectin S-receptor-like serine/threonine-protein kinase [Senna tora]|uniref:G-type lectin S-receptor-like serine/threonine-protein kinase n=1 Tax=Senna tora TaxID=362788 RepID=A0A834SRI5_9FABA|nr:G-type lectin S-receptor-like serine/threonine-protein kinase [Senna tora]